ncbi:AAA family ATPase [Exiguobacterium artemiae]
MLSVNSYIFEEYSNINNLSIIVGNNGAGKTTLLKNIRSFLDWNEHESYSNLNNVGVFFDLDTNEFSYYSANQIDELEVKFNYTKKQIVNKISEKKFKKLVSSKSIGYLTENFNSSDFFLILRQTFTIVRLGKH